MGKSSWRPEMIPDLSGKTILVTGANSGIGLEAVKLFAGRGAEVIMACRNADKANAAAQAVKAVASGARLSIMALDLADLASVKAFAEAVKQRFTTLDVLLNNAGLMAPPLQRTRDGFEMQFGTNHLGHFALTGQLIERLESADDPRIVQISSLAHRGGKLMWGNLNAEKRYSRWPFYCQSKLANLIFAKDLQRRLQASGSRIRVMAAHPGYSATHLQDTVPGGGLFNKIMAQSAQMGCLPGVMAATSDAVEAGGYYGPDGKLMELRGYPAPAFARKITDNPAVAQRLWEESERLTGVRYLND
ncbi:short-chain dehydrogenase [Alcanivorax sp. HI0033]|uniref:oxidoreductase n=1 Tax=unclassified Alcanivorax TaxID=2638842 RepID=UPI0007B819BD|nr:MULTISPECIES: oxidoreductase [unclassified Alcanivorax]KZX81860.1 short-chain dehydrogenase [Alcanivorax sp. HI0013]KZY27959.1 short-chain dehydrogenase [Alcanivorax sp. HI0035]KZX66197.1 short-chain dehydrogenase [Alcanivorax sp. HI0003]KZX72652.1 short-chain dehydrogenase [Alcanivorax sp. HI0007]KZY06436.1 short-chain dehydrogenase [Alcanivorax sp. HI0033]